MKASHILIAIALITLFVLAALWNSSSSSSSSSSSTTTVPTTPLRISTIPPPLPDSTAEKGPPPPPPPPQKSADAADSSSGGEKTFEEMEQHAAEGVKKLRQQQQQQQQQMGDAPSSPGREGGGGDALLLTHRVEFPQWSAAEFQQDLAGRQREEDEQRRRDQQLERDVDLDGGTDMKSNVDIMVQRDLLKKKKQRKISASKNNNNLFRVTSDGSVALLSTSTARLNDISIDARILGSVLRCSKSRGMYWKRDAAAAAAENAAAADGDGDSAASVITAAPTGNKNKDGLRAGACVPLEGWPKKLEEFEASSDELACAVDKQPSSSSSSSAWVKTPFQIGRRDAQEAELTVLSRFRQEHNTTSSSFPLELQQRYSRWMFWTSWLFHKWLPWKPLPAKQQQHQSSFRAFHNPRLKNLYQLENFCIDPFGGISLASTEPNSGSGGGITSFDGKQDDRGRFSGHSELLSRYFNGVVGSARKSFDSKLLLDERPVLFVPLDAATRNNIGHSTHRSLSAIAILDIIKEEYIKNHNNNSAAPLIVFVFEQHPDPAKRRQQDLRRVPAWGYFYRLLLGDFDAPYAVVMASSSYSSNYVGKLMRRTRHVGAFSVNASSSSSSSPSSHPDPILCFRRGFAAQSCLREGCHKDPAADGPTYSFENWVEITPKRRAVMSIFNQRQSKCAEIPAISSSFTPTLPRVFFDVRTEHRKIRHLSLFIEDLRAALVGTFVGEIVFAEPSSSGSRARYLRAISSADIFLGVHGGTLTQTAWMRPGGVVVELTEPYFYCKHVKKRERTSWRNCWFDLFTQFGDHDHWTVRLPSTTRNKNSHGSAADSFPLSPASVVAVLQQAACRWSFRKGQEMAACSSGGGGSSSAQQMSKLLRAIPRTSQREVFDQMMPASEADSAVPAIQAAFSPSGLNPFIAGRIATELREIKRSFVASLSGEVSDETFRFASDNVDLWQPLVEHFIHADAASANVVPFSSVESCVQAQRRGAVFGPLRTLKCYPVVCFDATMQQQQQQSGGTETDDEIRTLSPRKRKGDRQQQNGKTMTTEKQKAGNCLFRY